MLSVGGFVEIPRVPVGLLGSYVECVETLNIKIATGSLGKINDMATAIDFNEGGLPIGQACNDVPFLVHSVEEILDASFVSGKGCCKFIRNLRLNIQSLEDIHHDHHGVVAYELAGIVKDFFAIFR